MASIAALVAIVPACSKKQAEPPATVAAPNAATAKGAAPSDAKPVIAHGLRKLKNLDVPVFVDGEQVAVLRYGELPSQLKVTTSPTDEYHAPRFYRVADYLAAIGVDVNRVKRVDVAGVRDKIGSVTGTELRSDKARFVFDFLQTTTGAPKVAWDTTGLENELRVFDIYAVNVFVKDKPWAVDRVQHCYLEDDHACRPVARFPKEDLIKGTRVYVDGKMVAHVKRRLVADSAVADKKTGDGEALFSFDKYLASLGVDASKAKRVELLAGDSVIASADANSWVADREKLTFQLQRHSHGKVVAKIPADLQKQEPSAADRDVQVTAVEVFSKTDPRPMPLVAVDDIPDLSPLIETAQRDQATGQNDGQAHERDQQE